MLRLEKMEISGFKSFRDRTEVRFPTGITAVVGPNGCGKSNIGDAINWVLGEQSPKMLRGKQMADVIFAGSEAHKPVGMAEVSLHLRGAEGIEHGDGGAIVITRRLFRSGDSEYLLNGKRSRLKDIHDVLDEGHVGARTYATIEQGRIDQILNAKPKERRLLIEDAAGIAGYKHKRRLTELKLEATQANLLRVNDIVLEVERQIRSLKRQAARARRYRKMRDELRAKERIQFAVRSIALEEELEQARGEAARTSEAEAEAAARLSQVEVNLLEERRRLEQANRELRESADGLHRSELEIDRCEARIRSSRERMAESEEIVTRQQEEAAGLEHTLGARTTELGTRETASKAVAEEVERTRAALAEQQSTVDAVREELRGLRDEVERLRSDQFAAMNRAAESRNRLAGTREGLQRIEAQLTRLEQDCSATHEDLSRLANETESLAEHCRAQRERVATKQTELAACTERLEDARRTLHDRSEAFASARESEQSARARLGTLEDVATRFAGVSDGVRALIGAGAPAGLRTGGVFADYIEASTDVEAAAEGYLETFLPTVILESDEDVCQAARLIQEAGAGRTRMICRSQPAGGPAVGIGSNGHGEVPGEVLGDPRVIGRLRDRLTLRTTANGFIRDRLGDALVVDSLEAALELHRSWPRADYLTTTGDVVYASGVVQTGSAGRPDHGLLAHQRKTREAREALEQAAERAARCRSAMEQTRAEVDEAEQSLVACRTELEHAQRRLVELELVSERTVADHERAGRRSGVLAGELDSLRNEREQLSASLIELAKMAEVADAECRQIEERLRERAAVTERHEERAKTESEAAAVLRETLAGRTQSLEAAEQERGRLFEIVSELRERLERTRAEIDAATERGREAEQLRERTEAELEQHLERQKMLQSKVAELERGIGELGETVATREKETRGARDRLESLREAAREAELVKTRAESSREHLDALCQQELGCTAETAVRESRDAGVDLAHVEPEEVETEVRSIRDSLEKMGPVNMTAIEEFAELEQRHGFLTTQRADLERSMDSLKETIRRLNRSSREKFVEAFEAIRAHYQEIYRSLFNGGRADLRLEEGEDVLECGIEILAQPPGKRLSNVNLLSGGEKALSAISLLFAIFRYQPSPFCLLDEVDAALDDANVGRFAHMLADYSGHTQFIIVTHNKLTMESADLLYGVTMEEPGVSRLISMQFE